MRDYAKIPSDFWIGEVGKRLRSSREGQLVALYLQTNPHANALGLYYLPVPFLSHETGLDTEGAREGLRRCIEAGFCSYDEAAEVVWVHDMAGVQLAEFLKPEDKRAKWAASTYGSLPENRFLSPFFDRYRTAFHLEERRGTAGASKADRRDSEAPSEEHRSQELEQEKEKEKEKENLDPRPAAGVPRPRDGEIEESDGQGRRETVTSEGQSAAPPPSSTPTRKAPETGVVETYRAAWYEKYEFYPTPLKGEIIAAQRALKPYEPAEREAIVRAYVALDDPFLKNASHPLGLLPKRLDRIRTELAGTHSSGRKRTSDSSISRVTPPDVDAVLG